MTAVRGRRIRVPGLELARSYDRSWLGPDTLAAVTVWALLVPQALAYAQLAKVDPVVGLYAAIGAAVGYVLLGGVRSMNVGPEATIALLTASIVAPLAAGDPSRYLALTGGLALIAGGWLILSGLVGLGFVTRFLSRPLLMGYVAGSAIVMIVSQLDSIIGVKLTAQDNTLAELVETARRLPETHALTLAVGLGVVAVVVVLRRIDRRIPAYLVAVAVAIIVSSLADLASHGVAVVGAIAPGLPRIGLPSVTLGDLAGLVGPALGLALLIFADSGVTGQMLGKRGGYAVDGNQEFVGLGAANLGAALTGGFPVNGSQSRSFTAADVGARSQAMNLGVLALVILTLLVLTPLFTALPKAALAGVIIVVAGGLLEPAGFRELARVDRRELALALMAASIVIGVGMLAGVFLTVGVSLFLVAVRAANPHRSMLVRVPGTDSYRSAVNVVGGVPVPGVVVYRFDAPLFFANAQILADDLQAATAVEAAQQPVRWVVIDAEAISDVDSTGAAMLGDLIDDLGTRGIALALARLKEPVAAYLSRAGVMDKLGPGNLYVEVDDAVDAVTSGVEAAAPKPTKPSDLFREESSR